MKKTKAKAAPPPAPPQVKPPVDTGTGAQEQSAVFEKAVSLFRAGDFGAAGKLFEKAAAGPVLEVSHVARVHMRVCARRIERAAPSLASAEDHYNYAIALLNLRDLAAAERHLQEALQLNPNADYVHYALALGRGLRGELQQSYESLRRAIELDPRNRATARSDPDFAGFAHQQPFISLLYPGKEQRP